MSETPVLEGTTRDGGSRPTTFAGLKPHFAKMLVTDITPRDVADYIKARRQDKIADKSIRNELGTLRAILKKHRRWETIKDDVMLPKGREDRRPGAQRGGRGAAASRMR